VNIYELGLIYGVKVEPSGTVHVTMTLTAPNCPAAQSLPLEVESKVGSIEGVTDANVEIVWEPPWEPSMMSEAAKLELGML
jgi:FeS assembly SUF system protein